MHTGLLGLSDSETSAPKNQYGSQRQLSEISDFGAFAGRPPLLQTPTIQAAMSNIHEHQGTRASG